MNGKGKANWLTAHADVAMVTGLLLVLAVGLYLDIAWPVTAASALLTFAIPGWLLVRLLFGERPFELEVEVLLILFVSAFLVSLEVLLLLALGWKMNRELVLVVCSVTDVLLLIGLKIKDGVLARQRVITGRPHWAAFWVAVVVPAALFGFGVFHAHETRESFTEFYVGKQEASLMEGVQLVIESHEEEIQLFTLTCQAGEEQMILGNYEISSGQRALIDIAYSQSPAPGEKLKIALNQHKGALDYRWLEIPGGDCRHLTVMK